jgi:hypothetical protein
MAVQQRESGKMAFEEEVVAETTEEVVEVVEEVAPEAVTEVVAEAVTEVVAREVKKPYSKSKPVAEVAVQEEASAAVEEVKVDRAVITLKSGAVIALGK